jgi:hypothetical protein
MYRTAAVVQHKMAVHLLKQKAAGLEIDLVLQRMTVFLRSLHFAADLPEQVGPWQQGGKDQRYHQHIPLTEWQQPKDKKKSFGLIKILRWFSTSKSSPKNYFIYVRFSSTKSKVLGTNRGILDIYIRQSGIQTRQTKLFPELHCSKNRSNTVFV